MARILSGAGPVATLWISLALSLFALPALGQIASPANPARAETIQLAPHRAVYDLRLQQSRGKRPIESVRGRILYDFSGNDCEGYALQFRHVSELRVGEGDSLFNDLRATTWEDGKSKAFRFNSQNYMNNKLVDSVDGRAEHRSSGLSVRLTKPSGKTVTLDGGLIFPTEHMRRILAAARAQEPILTVPVFDGSETGEKTYNTLAVIGKTIPPGASRPEDAAGKNEVLSKYARWPVRISYFDKAGSGGEQTPVYGISFELYENGVSRALALDYNDFVISGEISSLEFKKQSPCR